MSYETVYWGSEDESYWTKTVYPKQCSYKFIVLWESDRCQGEDEHAGDHWAYSPNGTYNCSTPEGGSASIPPGSNQWVSPVDRAQDFWRNLAVTSSVIDKGLIGRLCAREDFGDDVAIMSPKPCTEEEIEWLRANGRLKGLPGFEETP